MDVTGFMTDQEKDELWIIHYAKMLESGVPASTIFKPVYLRTSKEHSLAARRFYNKDIPPTPSEVNIYPLRTDD